MKSSDLAIDIYIADETRIKLVKTVLAYESAKRGLTFGQTVAQLVEQAIDLDSYPDTIKSHLDQIEEEARILAAERACNSTSLPRSA